MLANFTLRKLILLLRKEAGKYIYKLVVIYKMKTHLKENMSHC